MNLISEVFYRNKPKAFYLWFQNSVKFYSIQHHLMFCYLINNSIHLFYSLMNVYLCMHILQYFFYNLIYLTEIRLLTLILEYVLN